MMGFSLSLVSILKRSENRCDFRTRAYDKGNDLEITMPLRSVQT